MRFYFILQQNVLKVFFLYYNCITSSIISKIHNISVFYGKITKDLRVRI